MGCSSLMRWVYLFDPRASYCRILKSAWRPCFGLVGGDGGPIKNLKHEKRINSLGGNVCFLTGTPNE